MTDSGHIANAEPTTTYTTAEGVVTYSQTETYALGAITRPEVMARAKTWVDEGVPYSMYVIHSSGWRADCSGFVSMAWNLSKPGLSTVTLPNVSHPISKDELKPGDILLKGGPGTEGAAGHVRVFGDWLDGTHSRYWVYEQTPPKATYNEYTWNHTAAEYPPYRYNNIGEERDDMAEVPQWQWDRLLSNA